MYYISNICFLCLNELITSKHAYHKFGRHDSLNKRFKMVFPELIELEPEIPSFLCPTCFTKLNDFYKFKILSIQKFLHWRDYVRTLKETNDSPNNILNDLQIEINIKKQITEKENETKLINETCENIIFEPDITPVLKMKLKSGKEVDKTSENIKIHKTCLQVKLEERAYKNIYKEEENSKLDTNKVETSATQIVVNMQEDNSKPSLTKNGQKKQKDSSADKSKIKMKQATKIERRCCLESHLMMRAAKKHYECFLCKKMFSNENDFKTRREILRKLPMKKSSMNKEPEI